MTTILLFLPVGEAWLRLGLRHVRRIVGGGA